MTYVDDVTRTRGDRAIKPSTCSPPVAYIASAESAVIRSRRSSAVACPDNIIVTY